MRPHLLASALLLALTPAVAYAQTCPIKPKNVILMIADGMGFNAWMGADYFEYGRTGAQPYQQVRPDGTRPVIYGVATSRIDPIEGRLADPGYNPDRRWAEQTFTLGSTGSSEASTAMHSGRKTLNGYVNVAPDGSHMVTAVQQAEAAGKATGVVTSVQISHATPAGAWAHTDLRSDYGEIFRQMTDGGLDVLFGSGHPMFDPGGVPVAADVASYRYVGGREIWDQMVSPGGRNGYRLIDTVQQFEALARGEDLPARVIGIGRAGTAMQYERPLDTPRRTDVPSLGLMSQAALTMLSRDPDGFMITIEGGAPDWASHDNDLDRYLEEMIDFNAAIAATIDWVETHSSWDETLLIITADHETGGLWGRRTWTDVDGDNRFDAAKGDQFFGHFAPRPTATGERPDLQYSTGGHSGDLVPLWAFGVGAETLDHDVRMDAKAASLWGEAYNWDGRFIDNTTIHRALNSVVCQPGEVLPQGDIRLLASLWRLWQSRLGALTSTGSSNLDRPH